MKKRISAIRARKNSNPVAGPAELLPSVLIEIFFSFSSGKLFNGGVRCGHSYGEILFLLLLISVPLVGCAGRNSLSGPQSFSAEKIERVTINAPLRSRLQIDRSLLPAGPDLFLNATFEVRNTSGDPITVEFSSGQQYDLWIEDPAGNRYWRWSDGRSFTMMLVSRELGTTSWIYQEKVPAVDSNGVPLRPGVYILYARLTAEPFIENWIAFKIEQQS